MLLQAPIDVLKHQFVYGESFKNINGSIWVKIFPYFWTPPTHHEKKNRFHVEKPFRVQTVLKYVNYDVETANILWLPVDSEFYRFSMFFMCFWKKKLFLHFATLVHDRQCCLQAPINEEKTNLHNGESFRTSMVRFGVKNFPYFWTHTPTHHEKKSISCREPFRVQTVLKYVNYDAETE